MKQQSATKQKNREEGYSGSSISPRKEHNERKNDKKDDKKLNTHEIGNRARKGYHNDGPGGSYGGF